MVTRLRDSDVRTAAKMRLLGAARRCPQTLVIDELGLEHGASRVDIAVINGHIRGLEIKADADTLERLPRQIEAYGRVVDKATLVAADRHVTAALDILPHWWGVISVARSRSGGIAFRRLRPERINPGLDSLTLARLLWRSEAIAVLTALGQDERALKRLRRAELYVAMVDSMSKTGLRAAVRQTLKARGNWRDRARPWSYDGSYPPSATY